MTTQDRLRWLKTLFSIQGLGWQFLGPIISIVVLTVLGVLGYLLLEPVQDAADFLSGVLTSEAKIWHVLVALGVEGIAIALIAVVVRRKLGDPSTPSVKVSVWSFCPTEIDHFGVLWPIETVNDASGPASFEAGRPMCPECHTPLSFKGSSGGAIPLIGDQWQKLAADEMTFECPRDGSKYDLREQRWPMSGLTSFVNDLAMGEYRAAQAAARSQE